MCFLEDIGGVWTLLKVLLVVVVFYTFGRFWDSGKLLEVFGRHSFVLILAAIETLGLSRLHQLTSATIMRPTAK